MPSPQEAQPDDYNSLFSAMRAFSFWGPMLDEQGRFYKAIGADRSHWALLRTALDKETLDFKWFIFDTSSHELRVHQESIDASDGRELAVLSSQHYAQGLLELPTLDHATPNDWEELNAGLAIGQEARAAAIRRVTEETREAREIDKMVGWLREMIARDWTTGDGSI